MSSEETAQERLHWIEQSLAMPLEPPKSDPVGVMAQWIVLFGLAVWWFLSVATPLSSLFSQGLPS